jgi:hypothetical protein
MNIQLKQMKLFVKKIDSEKYKRTITDLQGNLIWDGGEQFYVYQNMVTMDKERMNNLITQMKQLPFWNIVEVENDFA